MSRSPAPRRRAALAAALALVALAAAVARDATARFLIVDDPPGPCDAVVVMAGDPDYERTAAAVALMRRENIATLILTGGEPGPGDSAESLRARAIALGVPETRIHIETVSHSTHEAVLAVAPILQSDRRAHGDGGDVAVPPAPCHRRRPAGVAGRCRPRPRGCSLRLAAGTLVGDGRRPPRRRLRVREAPVLRHARLALSVGGPTSGIG
jgi:hypothetical protein